MMRQYAETRDCRGRALLAYFGEQVSGACGHCDNCAVPVANHGQPQPFPVSSAVRHPEWGAGTVMGYERDRVVVLFHEVGYKTLSVPIVRQRGLLTTVD
jgi:ATP-dependent DNA helicase RecQ